MTVAQQIPHSVGCEKSVVSTLLNCPHRADDAINLTEDHFFLRPTKLFFRYVMAQIRAGGVDTTMLCEKMNEDGVFDRAGGGSALADLYTYAPSDGHFIKHVQELNRFLAYRKTIEAAEQMKDTAYSLGEPSEILTATSEPVTEIQDLITGASSRSMSKGMVIEETLSRFESKCRGETTPMGLETSLDAFNRAFHGLHPKKTIVISAYPGGGKTTLATQLCMDAAMKGGNVLMCSLEMPQVDIMDRMLAYASGKELQAVNDPLGYTMSKHGKPTPTKELLNGIMRGVGSIKDAAIEIEDMVASDVYQIAATIRRNHRRKPLDVVAVDYAQRIRPAPEKARESREQQLSHASNFLADLSKELGFTLLLPSQLNKQGAAKHAEAINEDADIHIQILQDDQKNHVGIMVEKNRGGESGNILPLILDGPMSRFVEREQI